MNSHMENLTEKIEAETFIERSHEILEESKLDATSLAKAQQEARDLLRQFEEYLNSKGLECC